jgi:hypothetical protein
MHIRKHCSLGVRGGRIVKPTRFSLHDYGKVSFLLAVDCRLSG